MRVCVSTLFPEMVQQALGHSMMGRAQAAGLFRLETSSPRDFAKDVHRTVDDSPYGGGPGMVMRAPEALESLRSFGCAPGTPVLAMDPAGEPFTQSLARELAAAPEMVLFCGHYEGFDERILELSGARPVSIGSFVLTGGELPALMVIDAVVRLLPGVLGDPQSHEDDSYGEDGLLGFPLYTRPAVVEGREAPPILQSGDHKAMAKWRRMQQVIRTRERRPELLPWARLDKADLDGLGGSGSGGG